MDRIYYLSCNLLRDLMKREPHTEPKKLSLTAVEVSRFHIDQLFLECHDLGHPHRLISQDNGVKLCGFCYEELRKDRSR